MSSTSEALRQAADTPFRQWLRRYVWVLIAFGWAPVLLAITLGLGSLIAPHVWPYNVPHSIVGHSIRDVESRYGDTLEISDSSGWDRVYFMGDDFFGATAYSLWVDLDKKGTILRAEVTGQEM
ncbi:MAG: hypothetical protein ABI743_14000 [bacterium]